MQPWFLEQQILSVLRMYLICKVHCLEYNYFVWKNSYVRLSSMEKIHMFQRRSLLQILLILIVSLYFSIIILYHLISMKRNKYELLEKESTTSTNGKKTQVKKYWICDIVIKMNNKRQNCTFLNNLHQNVKKIWERGCFSHGSQNFFHTDLYDTWKWFQNIKYR